MVVPKRRDPLIYAGVEINFCNNLPIEQVISNFILLEKNRCNKFRGCLTLEKNLWNVLLSSRQKAVNLQNTRSCISYFENQVFVGDAMLISQMGKLMQNISFVNH